ncbi:MAG: glycosyltransferase family 2 protein [Dysgonamonadaceae bacterium]|jgi:GT2 family glycosyltransferase|nr:glycosyltransferase family 2 protein [Dysgonamonadaceae bacterium]
MKQTAIVILNWNGRKLLEQFLPSVLLHTPTEMADIIVADNGSTDDSVAFLEEHYPSVIVRALGRNYGFAKGYNRILDDLDYEYVVLLNSDVEVLPEWLRQAVGYLETHLDVVALQPKILSYRKRWEFEYAGACGGFMDKNGYPLCRGRILSVVENDTGQYETPVRIFWASGACLFIRLQVFKDAGGFDDGFFAHQEEIDLCWRLNARGKKIVCLPQSAVFHVGGATLGKADPKKDYLNFRNNLLMLYKNLPEPHYSRVMHIRFVLDYLSAIHCLWKRQWANAWAICKARWDFHRMKTRYRAVREENLRRTRLDVSKLLLPQSIIWEYYVNKKRKISEYGTAADGLLGYTGRTGAQSEEY